MATNAMTLTLTILDLPELLAILEEALEAVPAWERAGLADRLERLKARARRERGR